MPSLHCDSRVRAVCADALALTPRALRALQPHGFSAVLSDMAPSTSGSGSLDATRSAALAEAAVALALGDCGVAAEDRDDEDRAPAHVGVLLPGGALVVKLLEGEGGARQALQAVCKARCALAVPARLLMHRLRTQANFAKVSWMRPKATRSISRETYLVALGRQRAKGM